MAGWELPLAAILAKGSDFDQTMPICLGPVAWEWRPWVKASQTPAVTQGELLSPIASAMFWISSLDSVPLEIQS